MRVAVVIGSLALATVLSAAPPAAAATCSWFEDNPVPPYPLPGGVAGPAYNATRDTAHELAGVGVGTACATAAFVVGTALRLANEAYDFAIGQPCLGTLP